MAANRLMEGITMNTATLIAFREIAALMAGAPQDWQWIGPHMSQRMFGITEQRARDYAARHGGTARKMEDCPSPTNAPPITQWT